MDATYEINNESNNRINNALMMNEKEYIKSQQPIIDDFYKEYFTYDISNVGYWFISGIFTFIQLVFMALPFENIYEEGKQDVINTSDEREFLVIMACLIVFPVFFYMQPYVVGNINRRVGSIYANIKYLPVSVKSIRLYRFKKMLKFVLRIFLICVVLQLGISLLVYHRIMWQTLIYLFIYGFMIPFLMGLCATIGLGEVYFNNI